MAFIYFKFTKTPLPSFGSCESGRILIRGEKELKGRDEKEVWEKSGSIGTKMSGRKETVLDLAKFVDKGVQVKLTGGRQVTGTLKGYDQLLNLVLDEAIEFLRDSDDPLKTTDQTRRLGLIVCRGTAVMLVSPTDGTDEIANPFVQPEGA
ncbi:hypothetical protein J5N97_005414 [Dioscorea zingiberensis]|uniref:Sm domain-containing protein n=1 Tax=Dioscorea zingiberensis TaxID=325984 RepID=A0A9D5D8E2_9LILI|nr:hypothetical protein J5N97_005414 [Dioscorea zingiberensis]